MTVETKSESTEKPAWIKHTFVGGSLDSNIQSFAPCGFALLALEGRDLLDELSVEDQFRAVESVFAAIESSWTVAVNNPLQAPATYQSLRKLALHILSVSDVLKKRQDRVRFVENLVRLGLLNPKDAEVQDLADVYLNLGSTALFGPYEFRSVRDFAHLITASKVDVVIAAGNVARLSDREAMFVMVTATRTIIDMEPGDDQNQAVDRLLAVCVSPDMPVARAMMSIKLLSNAGRFDSKNPAFKSLMDRLKPEMLLQLRKF